MPVLGVKAVQRLTLHHKYATYILMMKFFDRSPKETPPQQEPSQEANPHPGSRMHHALARAADKLMHEQMQRQEEEQTIRLEHEQQLARRKDFLESTGARPVSSKLYALWLYAYLEQGNDITHTSDRTFPQAQLEPGETVTVPTLHSIGPNGPVLEDRQLSYYDQEIMWVPTVGDAERTIPAGYGSESMTVMHLPDFVQLDTQPTSGDDREGWEYGHTALLSLELDDTMPTGLRASTSQSGAVESYTDVVDMMMGIAGDFDPQAMVEAMKAAKKKQQDPGGWLQMIEES